MIQKFTLKITKFFVLIEIGMEEVLLVTLEVTLATNQTLFCQMKWKIIPSIFQCHAQSRSQLELLTDPQNRSKFLDIFEENLLKSTRAIVKFTS